MVKGAKRATLKERAMTAAEVVAPAIEAAKAEERRREEKRIEKKQQKALKKEVGGFEYLTDNSSNASPEIWFILAIILYISDIFITRFNGIDVDLFLSRFIDLGPQNISRLFLNGFVLVFLITYYLFQKPDKREFLSFFVLIEVFTLIFSLGGFSTGSTFHILFVVILYLFYIMPISKDKASSNFLIASMIFFDFFGFGLLAKFTGNPIVANRLIIPIWIYFIIFTAEEKPNWMNFLTVFIIIINVFYFANGLIYLGRLESGLEAEQIEKAEGFWNTSLTNLKDAAATFLDPLYCSGKADYSGCLKEREYQRYPERHPDALKGETIKELTSTTVKFEKPKEIYSDILKKQGTKHRIPYDLTIESLEKPISIELNCKFKKKDKELAGTISPSSEFEFEGPETKKRISCEPEEKYTKGDYKVIFEAKIKGIETISFLDRIFIGEGIWKDKDEISSILKLWDPPLKERQGSKAGEEFAAFYFEIGTQQTLIYSKEEIDQPLIGNIKNLKKGKVLSVERVEIDLRHPGIIPSAECGTHGFTMAGNTLVWQGTGLPDINCLLTIPEELRELDNYIYRPVNFKAYMIYNYQITKEDKFKIIGETV